jgi:hypothetical protein
MAMGILASRLRSESNAAIAKPGLVNKPSDDQKGLSRYANQREGNRDR